MLRIPRYLLPAAVTLLMILGGYAWLREGISSRIYRDKLENLSREYAALVEHYNHAVRQSAITELEVTDSTLAVLIRTADGAVRRIPTPFHPQKEIFVDYLVGDGKIWIRRIFDADTAPGDGLVIDPVWETVDWKTAGLNYGKTIYRSLEPGIWTIRVSGNGALDLMKAPNSRKNQLQASPAIRSFEEVRMDIEEDAAAIGFKEIWAYLTDGFN